MKNTIGPQEAVPSSGAVTVIDMSPEVWRAMEEGTITGRCHSAKGAHVAGCMESS